jgi:Werner syndrome ATP-dependent helicase
VCTAAKPDPKQGQQQSAVDNHQNKANGQALLNGWFSGSGTRIQEASPSDEFGFDNSLAADIDVDQIVAQHIRCSKKGTETEQAPCAASNGEEPEAMSSSLSQLRVKCLKPFQRAALAAWRSCQDCVVLAATGSGKSLCFQLPAVLPGSKTVIVVSPLISLMKDQVTSLQKKGISCCYLGSAQSDSTVLPNAIAGRYKLVYLCPETLTKVLPQMDPRQIGLFAIDEAHCISKWGHDFRPSYCALASLRQTCPGVPILALTATATPAVRAEMVASLQLRKPKMVVTSFYRPNLNFEVRHSKTNARSYEADLSGLFGLGGMSTSSGSPLGNAEGCGALGGASGAHLKAGDVGDVGEDDDDDDHQQQQFCHQEQSDRYIDLSVDSTSSSSTSGTSGTSGTSTSTTSSGSSSHGDDAPMATRVANCSHNQLSTIIYAPTRKEVEALAQWLVSRGVCTLAYHAGLKRSHLDMAHRRFR